MATENILMYCVKKGGDRQKLHEAIRKHSVEAGRAVKLEGKENDLLRRIENDPVFGLDKGEIDAIIKESCFTGLAAQQTREYLLEVRAVLAENAEDMKIRPEAVVNV